MSKFPKTLLMGLFLTTALGCEADDISVEYSPMESLTEGSWAAFRFDPQRTGHNPHATTGQYVREAWRVADINTTMYGAAKGSPSIADGVLYIGSDDARFQAFDAATGDNLWSTTLPETSQGIHGSPSIGPDYVYIGGYNGILYAFDKATGDKIWEFKQGFQIGASPILVPEHGIVYNTHERSNTGGGHIVAVDGRTGEEEWVLDIRAHPHASVAVAPAEDLLFVGDNASEFRAVSTRSGNVQWMYPIPQTPEDELDVKTTATVIERHGIVVVGAWSRKVHAFDMESGDIAWEAETGGKIMGSTAYSDKHDMVYVGSMSPTNALVAIDAETGAEAWRAEIGSTIMSSPAINGDESLVIVGAHNGNLYALNTETGEEVWRYAVGGVVSASPSVVGNMVYIAARGGDLVALETSDVPFE